MKKQELEKSVEAARKSPAYINYLTVRDAVFAMLQQQSELDANPSGYWRSELAGFDYLFDASPLIIAKLRHHAYHLTGLKEYEYRSHHSRITPQLEKRLQQLKERDFEGVRIPESPLMGGFGYTIDGELYNADTLKFYESLIVLDEARMLDQFRNAPERKIVCEIGAGWGGLAYQFKTLFPHTTYVIVDLPGSILFGATYLKTLFPQAKTLIIEGMQDAANIAQAKDYDFIFVPHFAWKELSLPRPDLLMNMCSFQEMTTAQVKNYIAKAHAWGIPHVYSINRDHSPNNPELTRVSRILSNHYAITLDTPTFEVKPELHGFSPRSVLIRIKRLVKKAAFPQKENIHQYHHLLGTLH